MVHRKTYVINIQLCYLLFQLSLILFQTCVVFFLFNTKVNICISLYHRALLNDSMCDQPTGI